MQMKKGNFQESEVLLFIFYSFFISKSLHRLIEATITKKVLRMFIVDSMSDFHALKVTFFPDKNIQIVSLVLC